LFAFWSFKSRQDKNRPNHPLDSQLLPTHGALAGQ
jgi:hypothetical protein